MKKVELGQSTSCPNCIAVHLLADRRFIKKGINILGKEYSYIECIYCKTRVRVEEKYGEVFVQMQLRNIFQAYRPAVL